MAIERFFISEAEACKYLEGINEGKYPFRLVTFKKSGDVYEAFMTDKDWPDMGFALRGLYPIVEDRRDSFFGSVNLRISRLYLNSLFK